MTAIYYPEGITARDLLPKIDARGVVVAGGLIPSQDAKYFRVGHVCCE
jgi:alanine-glyoxylate transaminase/serine-glyoxylate transaminase/serine-pyruvate transaminase